MIVDAKSLAASISNGRHSLPLSPVGALTQFGIYLDTLDPGAQSSLRHWHEREDEFLYVLDGTVTLHDSHGHHDLLPGDAVAWRHGDPNAHHLLNRGKTACRYLIVGSRVEGDICHYPDDGRTLINEPSRWQVIASDGSVLREGPLPPELLNLPPVWGRAFVADGKPNILRSGSVAAEEALSNYPEPWRDLGLAEDIALSDAGGLSQFGAFVEILHPGAQSSLRHWHEAEDEFLYVLSGHVTLIENTGPQTIGPGSCVCWPKGVPNGHCLRNDSDQPARLFIVGTRLREDAAHYPDIDLHYSRRNGLRGFYRKDGTPYSGWPKESNR